MTYLPRTLAVSATALWLAATCCAANAKPTRDEVARAHASCGAHKQRVLAMESRGGVSNARLERERTDWENACAHAENLANARDGTVMPEPKRTAEFSEYSAIPPAPADTLPPDRE